MTGADFPETFAALCGAGGDELYELGRLDQPVVSASDACEPEQADVEMRHLASFALPHGPSTRKAGARAARTEELTIP